VIEVDQQGIGLGTRGQPSQVAALDEAAAAERGGVETPRHWPAW